MGMNKGEWSELYALLYLMINRNLKLVDHSLNVIDESIFEVKRLANDSKEGEITFHFNATGDVVPTVFNVEQPPISNEEIEMIKNQLFSEIGENRGTFSLGDIMEWLESHGVPTTFKAPPKRKDDIKISSFDNLQLRETGYLGYSIKSQIGSPATILNASTQTNFLYTVSGLTDDDIIEVNEINTNKKLRDRLSKIKSLGGNVEFVGVENPIFENNLRFIDSHFPQAIGETLLRFYESDTSNLLDLFLQTNTFSDSVLSSFKLKEFLKAVSFGMLPSEPWNGVYQANGGIVIVSRDSNIYVLDNIYHSEIVAEYLIQETKLETPSTSRYHMLELTRDELTNKVFFTLNLQVRYKK